MPLFFLFIMFFDEFSNKEANFTCRTGIEMLANINKLIALFLVDANDKLAVFRFFLSFGGSCHGKPRRLTAYKL